MLRKYAEATIISAEIAKRDAFGLVKASHRAVFDYEPRPGFLYVRSRMISSRCNDNHDEFPAEEIKKSWRTAKGKPAFVNHHNEDHRRMRGVIIDAALHEDTLPDGKPDVWIEALHELDAMRFPRLATAILKKRVNRTSMGCDVGFSVCSACGNKASTPAEYCQHIPRMKGKILYRHTASGEREGHLIREICYKLSFFENSFLVEDPADPTAVVTGIDDRGLKTAASKTAKSWMPEQGQNYHGTHCLMCGENVKYYVKPSQGQRGGTWSHPDGMKRDHTAQPADPSKVIDGIPAADAARDQAKAEMRKQLGLPSLRDRDLPPDPFTTTSGLRKLSEQEVECDRPECGGHWGRHGAAGLLIRHHGDDGETRYLLQKRAPWVDHGGTWSTPGGALHPGESPEEAAHREASEEMGRLPALNHHRTHTDDHGNWAYHTVIMDSPERFEPGGGNDSEHSGHGWFTPHEMKSLDLHPGFAQTLGQVTSMRKGAPFGGYEDFEECEERNSEKEDPSAYCGEIKKRTEGGLRTLAEIDDDDIQKGLNLPTSEQGHKDLTHEKAKGLADSLMAPLYEPHGGEENYHLHQNNESMMDLKRRYEGGGGKFGFNDEDDGGEPYYEVHHVNSQGKKTGWSIRHYADGPHAEIRHDAIPGESHDLRDIGAEIDPDTHNPFAHHRPPENFGHNDLENVLHEWHGDSESGAREHLEGSNPRIKRYRRINRLGYGETKAPADVDTLREENCPVCGETDSFDGDRCEVCHFIQPPSMFTDPDTGVAKQMDLRKDQLDQGMVGPNGEPLPDIGNQFDPNAEEGAPGTPGDQIADLFCPACGFSADTQPPMTNNDPSMVAEDGQQGLMEGDVCPNCGEATMLSPNDVGAMGGEVPQEIADDADADAVPDDQEPDVDEDGIPDDAEAEVGAEEQPDDVEQDEDQDGVPDDAEGPVEPDDEPDAVEDEEEPPKGRKDTTRRASRRGHERNRMNQPKTAATEASSQIAALKQRIAVQDEILRVAGTQLQYLANLAGVAQEFAAIKATGAKKIADIMNPAQPIPDPPSGAPTETTQQAEAPKTYDDPRNPGLTPGSVDGVPAQQVDTPLNPGVTLPTAPFNQLTDVTQPVAGTEEHVPLDQTKIETDVRVGDPMAGAGTPEGTAFPLTGPFAADGAASANTTTSPGYQNSPARTMASIRLAKLRKNAGLLDGNVDDLVAAAEIEKNASLPDALIEHEITTLDTIARVAARRPTRRPQGGPLPKTAQAERRAPSLVGAPEMATTAVASGFDDGDASDIFLS